MSDIARTTPDPLALIDKAITQGMNPDQLGKLFDLAERHQKNLAAERFAEAVTGFQSDCPQVVKDRTAKISSRREGAREFSYQFASIDDVMKVAGPYLAKWKIAVGFTTEPANGGMKITCRVRVGTHTEDTVLLMPLAGGDNGPQSMGVTLSYGKRYAICAALNIVCTDEDDDAAGLVQYASAAEVEEMRLGLIRTGIKEAAFLNWFQADALPKLLARDAPKGIDHLRRKATVVHPHQGDPKEKCRACGMDAGDKVHAKPDAKERKP